ncbi:MAG: DUF2461 domain-containing protein [Chitinophagaceae bacterium]|nr:MAG: DUF2461 domain-containing protein [Chitinophagaceae bacterium]
MLQSNTLRFLKSLARNNNKPWMDANRAAYETARADFAVFVQQLIDAFGKKEPAIANLLAKDCMFRINRDIRFAKDKAPYKKNFAASINKGGKKGISSAGYYFHVQPGETFIGGGIWMPEPADLKKIRQEIDYNYGDLKKLVSSKDFKKVYGDLDDSPEYKLTRLPKGYEPGNPAEEYIKLKSFIGSRSLTDEQLTDKSLLKTTVGAFEALKPLVDFLNQAMEG